MKIVKSKSGKNVTLLTPSEKKNKFKKELESGFKRTNAGSFKLDENKKRMKLTKEERIWRSGFNSGVTSSQKAYWGKRNKGKKK